MNETYWTLFTFNYIVFYHFSKFFRVQQWNTLFDMSNSRIGLRVRPHEATMTSWFSWRPWKKLNNAGKTECLWCTAGKFSQWWLGRTPWLINLVVISVQICLHKFDVHTRTFGRCLCLCRWLSLGLGPSLGLGSSPGPGASPNPCLSPGSDQSLDTSQVFSGYSGFLLQ